MWQRIPTDDGYLLLFCPQDTSVNQNIRVTWNFDEDVIIDITDYMFVIGPIC